MQLLLLENLDFFRVALVRARNCDVFQASKNRVELVIQLEVNIQKIIWSSTLDLSPTDAKPHLCAAAEPHQKS